MQQQQPPSGGEAGELRSDAKQLGNSAANRIHSEVDARKDNAVDQAKSVSSAIGRVAGEMDPNAPDWLKSAFRQGAQKLQSFTETLEQKDSRELLRDAQDFARENPGTFLAACAAAGFAAARVLKAGSEPQGSEGNSPGRPPYVSTRPGGPMSSSSEPQPRAGARTTGEFA